MKKFVLSLVLCLGGCINFGLLCIAAAIVGGYLLPILCLLSLALMIYGATGAYSIIVDEQNVPSPEEQDEKPDEQR